jgi:hypothetical protein
LEIVKFGWPDAPWAIEVQAAATAATRTALASAIAPALAVSLIRLKFFTGTLNRLAKFSFLDGGCVRGIGRVTEDAPSPGHFTRS